MSAKSELLAKLGWLDPFADFTPQAAPPRWTWNYDRDFLSAIYQKIPQPNLCVEVGSWLGRSAIGAAEYYAKDLNWSDFTLICIDTWLGSLEHWTEPERFGGFERVHGHPALYQQFLSNVMLSGMQAQILPLPQTSVTGARILSHFRLRPDWVYLDASHEPEDVMMDLKLYWPLIRRGGVLCGDDWNWPGVRGAVIDFCDELRLVPENSQHSWAIWKV
ncbi:MAG: class I SAM-dependent methyltransferase [Candidatus Melainabacteria bacterium HGW-Melainabacteria-1]|nr:MAG: class I SAM-dependent methyltransferase [Candidatus Melainabacteria bacterium HGW-Melainabacteria-1]